GPKTSIICSPMTSLKTSIKTITYLSDTGCLEIQGASLIRMHNARQLVFSKLSVNQISIRCGYASTAYFISVFRQYYGITPCQMFINQTMSVENRSSAQRSMQVSV
ncbi:AraC family transcriptional regulator, partial [Escherichia coli]|nr:AraC family transcriptional regulator [Escherichia coli]